MNEAAITFTPTEFIAVTNQTLENAYSNVTIVGEVASFKVNQDKWVFFDLKDEESSISCFMTLWSLRIPLEDGMKVVIRGVPKLTKWGKFSVTVSQIAPVGKGSLKKAFEMLKKKLTDEGLFDPAKKRTLPEDLTKLGVISSTQAAGYADFIKIVNARWGGMKISVAHTQVQGLDAPDQIIRALNYFNERGEVQVIAILRGGGSADDLAAFNDEKLVRAVAASKIPVISGIGHEVDESLVDLAADVRASTPSNAAELLTHDRKAEERRVRMLVAQARQSAMENIVRAKSENREKIKKVSNGLLSKYIEPTIQKVKNEMQQMLTKIQSEREKKEILVQQKLKILEALNPEKVLKQGYAIIAGKISPGKEINITMMKQEIKAEVKEIYERK
ncbi:exodeoxyribonuclease VII large subunit [Candidatus Saccharibacteria bacterium]|nr:exodeoxyribonuclease VII large subunit [Candidatus Saccharibacteria bacterium]